MNVKPTQTQPAAAIKRRHAMVYLLIAIPAASVLMGILTLFMAFGNPDPEVRMHQAPLSKTSWQQEHASDR